MSHNSDFRYLIPRVALWSVGPPRPLNEHHPPLVLEEIRSFVVVTGHALYTYMVYRYELDLSNRLVA